MQLALVFMKENDNRTRIDEVVYLEKYVFTEYQTKFITTYFPNTFEPNKDDISETDGFTLEDLTKFKSDALFIIDKINNRDYVMKNSGSYKASKNRDIVYKFLEYILKLCDKYIPIINKEDEDNPEFTLCYFYYIEDHGEDYDYSIDDKNLQITTFEVSEWEDKDDNFTIPEKSNCNVEKIGKELCDFINRGI